LIIKAQLKEITGKEEENTRKKLEKVREDIKEDSQGQGFSSSLYCLISSNKVFINSSLVCDLCRSIISINKSPFSVTCFF
jgi:hypothetical protein